MRPSMSFTLRTILIAALSTGLALAFNANRTNPLPLTRSAAATAPADAVAPAAPAPTEGAASEARDTAPADAGNASVLQADDTAQQPADREQASPDTASGDEISLQDASLLFSAGQAVFVDARDAESYAEGHIQGALSVPVFSFAQDFPAVRTQLENATVITYCDGELCQLSRDLADQLRAAGLPNVLVLKNGWTLWKDAELPTASGHNLEPVGGRQ